MVSNRSLDEHVSTMVRSYSSLFTLPSHIKILALLCATCLIGGILVIFPLHINFFGLALGFIFGATFFCIVSLSDIITYSSFLRKDPIFTLRRCSALSLFSCLMWFSFIFLGSLISILIENKTIWVKLFLLGFSAVLMLRLLVFSTISFANRKQVFLSSFLQPALCTLTLFFMGETVGSFEVSFFLLFAILVFIALLDVSLFTLILNRLGLRDLGIPSIPLFRAFVANWTENLNEYLEGFLEKLGYEQDVTLSILAFTTNGKAKAVMVVPAFHSGPFRNVGSSLFPYMVQDVLGNRLHCVVSVPHGLAGHELDLSSQLQSKKVVEKTLEAVDFSQVNPKATPFTRSQNNEASASCQVFGDCALLTLTLSPKTMEDLPQELRVAVVNEAEKRGLSSAIVVDAHNSIDGPFNLSKALEPVRKAALASLEQALNLERASFEVGAAKIVTKEFGVKEGMGLGGISVIATRVSDYTTAYVTIDGNNMVSGLREEILMALRKIGVVGGEVLTTDTHSVNGVVLTSRGYHPVGEAVDKTKLINHIRQTAMDALSNLEPAEVSWCTERIHAVKVIGEKQIKNLCLLAEKTAKQARNLAASLFSATGVLLIVLLVAL